MDINTLTIPIAFIMLSVLLLWFIIDTKRKWILKLILIMIVPIFSIVVWQSLEAYHGWPTKDNLPKKAILIWFIINEPNPNNEDPGSIYLWLINQGEKNKNYLFKYKPKPGEPRVYAIPYSRKMHEKLLAAGELMKKGKYVEMEGEGGLRRRPHQDNDLRFYELPPPKLPEKDPVLK